MPRIMTNITLVAPPFVPPPVTPMVDIPTVVTPIAFALISGSINAIKIINLSSKIGILVYNQLTTSLTIPIDGNSKNINLLQSQLERSATNTGWNTGTGNILLVADSDGENKNILTEYRCLTKKKESFLNLSWHAVKTSQNDQMLVTCLLVSSTEG